MVLKRSTLRHPALSTHHLPGASGDGCRVRLCEEEQVWLISGENTKWTSRQKSEEGMRKHSAG
ncbi:hypothetical protein E2C01_071914 [Portunus trituberculatus]|uniref:Uncharacterized protein n=1 Tax=Portunus trituberculatus TaxID=210409 RepID=A0A5B7HYA3_PORTR|nr:hypothetical protein [Portunus trituberculatus]